MLKKLVIVTSFMIGSIVSAQSTQDPIVTESTSTSTVTTNGKTENIIKSPPASAISPNINTSNSDLCTVGVSGAVQTQIPSNLVPEVLLNLF